MQKRRMLTLLLCALLLLPGCGDGTTGETETTDAQGWVDDIVPEMETETEKLSFDVSGIDYDGHTVVIWNYDNVSVNLWDPTAIPNDLYSTELTGDVLNDAVYSRNKNVEEALNITLSVEDRDDGMTNGLRQAVVSGSQDVDMLFPRLYLMPSMVNGGYLLDMNTVPFRDTTSPWWNAEANDSLSIYGKQFGMVSDITYQDKVCTIVTYFNQQLAEDHQLGDLYQTVIEDKWTLDNLLTMGASVSQDLNGDGIYDQNDAYPLSCQNDAVYYLLHGGRIRFCEEDESGKIALSLTSEQAVTALQKIYTIMGDQTQFFNRQTWNLSLEDAVKMFRENRVMFLIRPIQSLFLMRDMEADFGILPTPKLTEDQTAYGTAVNPYAGTFLCYPKTVENVERNAVVTEMLAWDSHYTVISPLYENILGSKLVRDTEASAMLDIVFDTVIYDIGLIWNFNDMSTTLLKNTDTQVSSMLASISGAVEKAIEKLEETVK